MSTDDTTPLPAEGSAPQGGQAEETRAYPTSGESTGDGARQAPASDDYPRAPYSSAPYAAPSSPAGAGTSWDQGSEHGAPWGAGPGSTPYTQAPGAGPSPYAQAPGAQPSYAQQPYGSTPYTAYTPSPHDILERLKTNSIFVLVLGILGLVALGPFGSIPAWVWGNSILAEARANGIAEDFVANAKLGRILGIIATILWIVLFALLVLLFVLAVFAGVASSAYYGAMPY